MISESLYAKYYGDAKYDGTQAFYDWIKEHCSEKSKVLNLGAGPETKSEKRILRGLVARVIGADVDPIVFKNSELDEAHLIENGRIPIGSDEIDLVYSDFVLEHVEHPQQFLSEVFRVLKTGGHFMFRTPNRYHYVTLASGLTPHFFHRLVANPVRGLGETAHEPWPTFYRMNSRGALKRLAKEAGFHDAELRMVEAQPSYLMFHPLPFLLGVGYERLVNSTRFLQCFRCNIQGMLKK